MTASRPRVCVLTSVHQPFDQRIFYKEAVSLVEAGYEVTLVGPGHPACAGEHRGVRIRPLPVPTTRRDRLAFQARLLTAARRVGADIYHFHDPELLPLGCVLKALGRRVIYDVHEDFPAAALTRTWVPGPVRRPLSFTVDAVERVLARLLDGVVGVVEEQGARFRSRPFAAAGNYPRLEWFPPPPKTPGPGAPKAELVHVGSLSRERGAQFLLEIMRQVRRTHPRVRLNALGPFQTRADEVVFRAALREYGLADHVHCRTERLPYDELGSFIGGHRIGLIPGQRTAKTLTPFSPTKLFEYLACGLAVVASSLPSIEGFRQLGEWGVLADPDDPRDHARAITRLLDDPPAAERMGRAGRQVVESMCSWERESRKLLSLYDSVAGQGAGGRGETP